MNEPARKLLPDGQENHKNLLAPEPCDVLAFRKYTQRVWSKVAGRPISEADADEIMKNFSQFILALSREDGGQL